MKRWILPVVIACLGVMAGFPLLIASCPHSTQSLPTAQPRTAGAAPQSVRVGLINNFSESQLPSALALDASVNVTALDPNDFLSEIADSTLNLDVLVLANVTYTQALMDGIVNYLTTRGGSIFVLLGNASTSEGDMLARLNLVDSPAIQDVEAVAIWDPVNNSHPLVADIQWSSVPEARQYAQADWNTSAVDVLLNSQTSEIPLLVEPRSYRGHVLVVTPGLSTTDNRDFELGPYYGYFLYHSVRYLAGLPTVPYADWNKSPVIHAPEAAWIFAIIGILTGVILIGFYFARRRSTPLHMAFIAGPGNEESQAMLTGPLDPEISPATSAPPPHAASGESIPNPETMPIITGPLDSETSPPISESETLPLHITVTAKAPQMPSLAEENEVIISDWEQVGLHRQISSFFYNFLLSFITSIPMLVLSLYVYPTYIVPYPQVYGWQSWTGTFFSTIFEMFNLNIQVALTKNFAQYRVKDPVKAIKFIQFYIWYKIFSGLVEVAFLSALTYYYFTQSDLAAMSWFFILASIGQFPGMLGVINLALQAMQRFDKMIFINVIVGTLINTAISYGSILLFRFVFAGNPQYGAAFGATVGISLGGYLGGWTVFFLTAGVFRRLGYSVRALFRADFGREEMTEALRYGAKLTVGWIVVPLAGMIEVVLVSIYVLDFYAQYAYYNMMGTVVGVFMSAGIYYDSVRPGIAEAYGNGKMKLFEYYVTESFKWTNVLAFVPLGCALAASIPLLQGYLGSYWAPATAFLVVQCILQAECPYAWLGDAIFQGTGKTSYNVYVWFLEQGTRVALLFILLPILHVIDAIAFAYIVALAAKAVGIFYAIRKRIVKFDWCVGHTLLAPALALIPEYVVNLLFVALIWRGD
ncbi:MAG TPA: lipopolysaccharide biosynthesis protein, partial [Candidatus Lokiarchaeia archaeon]|nr:lipopolysaccharide biosynthesis protein [Candidatus Lokiarchaeia archaeon]